MRYCFFLLSLLLLGCAHQSEMSNQPMTKEEVQVAKAQQKEKRRKIIKAFIESQSNKKSAGECYLYRQRTGLYGCGD